MHGSGKLPWGRGLCSICDQCRATSSLSHPITGWTLTRLTGAGQSSSCSLAATVSHVARERWLEVFWILLIGSRYCNAHWDLWNGTNCMVQLLAEIISLRRVLEANPGRSHGSADTLPLRHSANIIGLEMLPSFNHVQCLFYLFSQVTRDGQREEPLYMYWYNAWPHWLRPISRDQGIICHNADQHVITATIVSCR